MRPQIQQQYMRIKNCPMRSPSPDYSCRNRSRNSQQPLNQSKILCEAMMNTNSTVQFPILPSQIRSKRSSKCENADPRTESGKRNLVSTANGKSSRNINSEVSRFVATDDNCEGSAQELQYIFALVEQVHERLVPQPHCLQVSQDNRFRDIIQKMKNIREKIFTDIPARKKEEESMFIHYFEEPKEQRLETKQSPQILGNSPIRCQENQEESMSIYQINEILSENNKLKQQIHQIQLTSPIQMQFRSEGSHCDSELGKPERESRIAQCSNESSFSCSTVKFLKQKVLFLETELENQLEKWVKLTTDKDEEINNLKEKLAKIQERQRSQANRYIQLIHNFQNLQISNSRNDQKQVQFRKITEVESLSWDGPEVVSINLQGHSQYSEAERVDIANIFNRQEQSKDNRNNDKLIMKYQHELKTLRHELSILKAYLQEADTDTGHHQNYDYGQDNDQRLCTACKKQMDGFGNQDKGGVEGYEIEEMIKKSGSTLGKKQAEDDKPTERKLERRKQTRIKMKNCPEKKEN